MVAVCLKVLALASKVQALALALRDEALALRFWPKLHHWKPLQQHMPEAEIWTHYSNTLWRLTLAAYSSVNNIQAVYHCLQVSTRGSSILSDRNVCSGCCQHWPSLSAFSSTWRSDRAQNENDNVWLALQSPNHVSGMISHRLCVVHRTRTVPKQTKDNTISLSLRDMTWHFHDCLGW